MAKNKATAAATPKLIMQCAADIKPTDIAWLWPDRIPLGCLTVIAGVPGGGKSYITADMAAHVSRGRNWPDGAVCPTGDVILVGAEDDAAATVRPRLDALGADCGRVHVCGGIVAHGGPKPGERFLTLDDLSTLKAALDTIPECRLLVIDPVGSFTGGRVDAHRDNEVRAVLTPLAQMAEERQIAVVLVAHTRKGEAQHADDAVLGSRAFTGVARSVYHLMHDPDSKDRRLLLPGKCNLACPPLGLAFTINNAGGIDWDSTPEERTANDIMAAQVRRSKPGPLRSARKDAAAWLVAVLADGPMGATEVSEQAEAAGLLPGTLRRAKRDAGAESTWCKDSLSWRWGIPDAQVPLERAQPAHLRTCPEVGQSEIDDINAQLDAAHDCREGE